MVRMSDILRMARERKEREKQEREGRVSPPPRPEPPKKEEPLLARVLLPTTAEAGETSGQGIFYTVKRNDTLWEIATKYGTTIAQLRKWNNLGGSSVIYTGDRLIVGFRQTEPSLGQAYTHQEHGTNEIVYTVKRGDTLWEIAKTHNVTINQIRHWNNLVRKSKIYPGEKFIIYTPS